jgi:transglutaminase-like putative cysteine protease
MEGKHRAHLLAKIVSLMLCCGPAARVAADVTYWNPRPYNVTRIFELEPDPNKIDRAKDLKLWLPVGRQGDPQKRGQTLSIDPPPDGTYEDPEFGVQMAFWDFGKRPEQRVYTVTIKRRSESYDIRVDVDLNKVGTYDKSSPEYKLYTRSEHTICLTPKIYELAQKAVGDEKNPYLQARRIAQYVYKKVHYKILDYERGRGIQCLLDYPVKDPNTGEEYYEGCCNQISAMIVALCRAVGIPARSVGGFCGWPPASELKPLYDFETKLNPQGLAGAQSFGQLPGHMWTEFYIPNYGWIPEDYVSTPFNCRMGRGIGRDIKIGPQCPEGDSQGYGSQWVLLNEGRVDMLGPVWNIAKIHTARSKVLLEFDPFPADALVDYRNDYDRESLRSRRRSGRQLYWERFEYETRGFPDLSVAFKQQRSQRFFRDAQVCNVLKNVVGKDKFSRIVTEYETMRVSSGKAVSVAQFQQLAEAVYGQSLGWFFEPWMDESQLPQFKVDQVSLDREGQDWRVSGHLLQTGKFFYRLPVELALQTERSVESQTLWQEERDTEFQLRTLQKPVRVVVDPNREIIKIERFPPHVIWCQWIAPERTRVIYGNGAEREANKAGAESLIQTFLPVANEFIKADTEATPDDLNAECLILVGRPEVNKISERLQDRFPIKFEGVKFTWQGKVYDQPSQGVIAVVDEGRSSKRLTVLLAGLSGEATRDFRRLSNQNWYLFSRLASYLVFDGDKCVVSGEWENANPDLVWQF